jgi:hypothetical protein
VIARFFKLEPALVTTAAAAVYAAAAMLYRAFVAKDVAVLDWDLLMAAVAAVLPLWARLRATPLERPRDAQGRALVPHVPATDRSGGM